MAKLKYLLYLLLGLSAIVFIYFFAISGNMEYKHYVQNQSEWMYSVLDGFLVWGYILTIIAALLTLALPIIGIVKNPKNVKKIGINIGAMILIVVVAFVFSSGDPLPVELKDIEAPSFTTLKWTSTGLIATYILSAVALLAIIAGAIMNVVRNR